MTYWEYQALLVAVAWVGGFAPVWWESWRHGDAAAPRRWRWWHAVGLALVLTPFVRMGVGAAFDLIALVQTTVSGGYVVHEPFARDALWRKVWRHAWYYLVIPVVGLLVMWGGALGRPQLARAGLAPREDARRDALHGLTLFFGVLVAYVGAMLVAYVLLRDVLVSTGDESQLWSNITIPLIVALSGIAGVSEEFLFRGLLLGLLARHMPWRWAAVSQAAFFGLVHAGYSTWAHVLGPFVFGLGMAYVVRHLGLIPAVILHAGVNITFFSIDVANAQPLAWGLIGTLLALNVYAAYATRFHAVRTLWEALRRTVTLTPTPAPTAAEPPLPPGAIVVYDARSREATRDAEEPDPSRSP